MQQGDVVRCSAGVGPGTTLVEHRVRHRSPRGAAFRLPPRADDTLVVGGEDWEAVRRKADLTLAGVVRAIRVLGLEVAPQKTEALFFHDGSLGKPPPARIRVGDATVEVGTEIKYLGLILDGRWGFVEHFARLSPKWERQPDARLMPNLGGPNPAVRKLYVHAVLSGLLYGAPV
ncbi:PREDICTED: uncharacterized protein LOC108783586 [Cyphomyrmex costatus]|uniref:uncharacterized protein LOC108783586 n=1 Tax=Cyphomyrmex costatus TaxID=456900 RepID=UPI0008521DB2|nr:PREDICTED: uncharacterized protein LOC108783586 [Cyphomyrmex costatus]